MGTESGIKNIPFFLFDTRRSTKVPVFWIGCDVEKCEVRTHEYFVPDEAAKEATRMGLREIDGKWYCPAHAAAEKEGGDAQRT